jgi:hypothetical protein
VPEGEGEGDCEPARFSEADTEGLLVGEVELLAETLTLALRDAQAEEE